MAADDAYSFELAWRWTQPSHAVFPPEVMAQIVPVTNPSRKHCDPVLPSLDPDVFDEIQKMSGGVSTEEGLHLLRQLPVPLVEQVTVEWEPTVAVRTTWDIFTRYWDDFCYPATDDVEVYPADEAWMFIYRHWQTMEWGKRRLTPAPPKHAIRVAITRFVGSERQPGIVEFELVDIHGRLWRFIDKYYMATGDDIDNSSDYPRPGEVTIEILSRRKDANGREVLLVDTSRPSSVETVDGVTRFEVFAEQVIARQ